MNVKRTQTKFFYQLEKHNVKVNVHKSEFVVSMFNYFQNFVHMCPDLLEPFHKLMRKDEPQHWSSEYALAFVKCKTTF